MLRFASLLSSIANQTLSLGRIALRILVALVGDADAEAGDLRIHDLVPLVFPGLLQTGDQGRGEVLPVVCLRHGRGHLGATRMRNAMRPNERV